MRRYTRKLKYLPIVIPMVFVIIFFGLLPPKYDIVLYVDNVVGEGICQTYTNVPSSFSPFFEKTFYCGSKLQKATLPGFNYNVSHFKLTFSDVSEVEIEGFDLRVFGIIIAHYKLKDRVPIGQFDKISISLSEDGERAHFSFDSPDEGTTIAIASHFAPAWFWILYFGLLLLTSILMTILLDSILKRFPALHLPFLSASAIIVTLLSGCFFCGSFAYVNYVYFLLNWLLFFAVSMLMNALVLPWIGTVLTMVFITFCYIANYFVITFRNKPIMPADLKAIGTAAEVMGNYNYTPNLQMFVGVLAVICYIAAVFFSWKKAEPQKKISVKKQLQRRGITAAAAILMIVGALNTSAFKSLTSFAWDAVLLKSFHEEGIALTFLKNAFNSGVKKPEGYSREVINEYLSEYTVTGSDGTRPTRIIMVMNEAFSDLRTVGLDDRINVMPFIDKLDENTIEGSLYVSIYGGGTCNTEFEALTGNTLAFLGTGVYPYTENVTKPMFSLAEYFMNNGYQAEAFHANEPQNWNRNIVYPYFGFSDFHCIKEYKESLKEIPYLHKLPADIADYQYMEQVDKENNFQPHFFFNVTMQNHSGYEHWEDLERVPSVEQYGIGLYLDTQIYLSLIKASDDAVRQLVETYQDSNEPTMIIFFGDHQPGLPSYAQSEIYMEAKSYLDYYKSKFFIWTNYKTETVHGAEISANYLPYLILERGNFPLPPYVKMLREVHEKYPVISAMGVIDAEGNIYESVNELLDDPLIRKYQYIQYANLFDEIAPAWFESK